MFVRAKTNSINMLVQQPAERVTSPPRPQDITSSVKLRRKNRDSSAEAIKKRNRYSGGDFRIGSPARGIAFPYQFDGIVIYLQNKRYIYLLIRINEIDMCMSQKKVEKSQQYLCLRLHTQLSIVHIYLSASSTNWRLSLKQKAKRHAKIYNKIVKNGYSCKYSADS